jgi:hypothetical protein
MTETQSWREGLMEGKEEEEGGSKRGKEEGREEMYASPGKNVL